LDYLGDWKMSDDYDDEYEEDDDEAPKIKDEDFFKIFEKLNVDFGGAFKDLDFFKNLTDSDFFKNIFGNIMKDILPRMKEILPDGGDMADMSKIKPEDLMKILWENRDKMNLKGPFVYGFNMTIGPDGKPKFSKFGNIQPRVGEKKIVKKYREPLTEVTEEDDNIIVVAEMPGVKKDDIELKSTEDSLTITATSEDNSRRYKKSIDLPTHIDPDHAKARYQNGILEVKLDKIKSKSKRIDID